MISKCANPDCFAPFDYLEGHLFRFPRHYPPNEAPPNSHLVQHFWLCPQCSETYTIENRGEFVLIPRKLRHSAQSCVFRQITAA